MLVKQFVEMRVCTNLVGGKPLAFVFQLWTKTLCQVLYLHTY